ncbi:MAG: ClbS/DfsB family four-helix bundle protein [Anaerolineae bacterium]|nr:ClbS/DfsB family four-helix bundle protein [Anaerolineae bacterium]
MSEEMNKAKLLELAQTERQRFTTLIGTLSQAQMLQPVVQGLWSVKDIVAHLTAWEERMVRWLNQMRRGETAFGDWKEIDVLNAEAFEERKDWPLERVLADSERSFSQAIELVQSVPEAEWLAEVQFPWGRGPLWHLAAANTFWHYPEHTWAIRVWLDNQSADPLVYYACPGPMTNPRRFARLFDRLPTDIPGLVKVVQGLMLHIFWAERYGVSLSDERKTEVQTRSATPKLARIIELDRRPLAEPRALENKLVSNCRDFSVLLCAMLRYQGVPARARCGFGAYFMPNHYEDHWVCEYWKADESRWVLVDAQLDELQCEALQISFNPLDVPRDQFIVAGKAWQMCREHGIDPELFGIFDMHGLDFVRGNLIRDFLAQNKVEILPWDFGFGFLSEDAGPELELMDHLAVLTQGGNTSFAEVRALYQSDERFHVPASWFNS